MRATAERESAKNSPCIDMRETNSKKKEGKRELDNKNSPPLAWYYCPRLSTMLTTV